MDMESVEEKLVEIVPVLAGVSRLCGSRLTPENASAVLKGVLHGLDMSRAMLADTRDLCARFALTPGSETLSPENPDHIYLTAEDWQLLPDAYTEDEEPIYKEAATVAEKLNATFNVAISRGLGERETRHMLLDVMEEHLTVGAGDTEPRHILGKLLIEHFGEEACAASGWDAWRNFAGPEHKADRERWKQEPLA